jgi:hypothetical protein
MLVILDLVENRLDSTIGDYAHNLLVGTRLRRLRSNDLNQLEDQEIVVAMARGAQSRRAAHPAEYTRETLVPALRRYFRRAGPARRPRPIPDPVGTNLVVLAQLLGLTELEREILTYLVCVHVDAELRTIADLLGEACLSIHARHIAAAIAQPADQTLVALSVGSRLIGSGAVTVDDCPLYTLSNTLELKMGIVDLVLAPGLDRDRVLDRFLPTARPPTLCREDFTHLDGPVRMVGDLLRAALRRHTRGVNVLFYGPTGTGKSELARLMAQEIPVKLYVAFDRSIPVNRASRSGFLRA